MTTTTADAGRLGGLARAAKVKSGELAKPKGRPKKPAFCRCGKKCKSTTEARDHCRKPKSPKGDTQ